ncbi:multidrug transporter [Salinirubellus sp. GCM10025818]|uniref:multidrug transporter n=1 Tax=Salinirubellus TaxID=2162630 RepID=UPI0030D5F279
MPGRSSQSSPLQYVGVAVALVAVVGSVALGWEFGGTGDTTPLVLGGTCAVVAVGWALYRQA